MRSTTGKKVSFADKKKIKFPGSRNNLTKTNISNHFKIVFSYTRRAKYCTRKSCKILKPLQKKNNGISYITEWTRVCLITDTL